MFVFSIKKVTEELRLLISKRHNNQSKCLSISDCKNKTFLKNKSWYKQRMEIRWICHALSKVVNAWVPRTWVDERIPNLHHIMKCRIWRNILNCLQLRNKQICLKRFSITGYNKVWLCDETMLKRKTLSCVISVVLQKMDSAVIFDPLLELSNLNLFKFFET